MEHNQKIIPPSDITHEFAEYGVIDRLGNYYQCQYSGHNDLAFKMQSRGMISDDVDYYNFFAENGWLILTGSMFTKCEFTFDFEAEKFEYQKGEKIKTVLEFKLTKAQIKAILDFVW